MKKTLMFVATLALLITLPAAGLAAGVTVRTTSNLFGIEGVAQAYMDALVAWEAATGNTVEDYSGLPDDMWQTIVLQDLPKGLYDVVYYFVANDDSAAILDKVVSLEEVRAAYPDAGIPLNPLAAEADGKVYAVPVIYYWEALFCNTELFETHGLELPTDWDKLGAAVMKLRELGIPPIAASLSDFPHYIVEAVMLASCSPADQAASPAGAAELPPSWFDGIGLIQGLYGAGAFGANATRTSEMDTSKAFREKEAAMQFDGSWFVASLPEENWSNTVVVPFPVFSPAADPAALIGGMSMGFYITRAAWDDPQRREAAVSLLQALTTDDMRANLGEITAGDALGESIQAMLAGASRLCAPIGERMSPEARDVLFGSISGIAEGAQDPAAVLREVADMGAFGH